ncbi:MAG: hypothetical protein JRF36_18370 [Deltaproteobacteria bacterium]|jgi:hypothetical protein|nr:hypothetical protein [Deltaproteobacteria bacterium]MBW2469422.1 hypothetical protein [Deltaproteobacteria bacterium]MBW2487434.1 hypothetical protein [Deltaproteobacteria bacterium]
MKLLRYFRSITWISAILIIAEPAFATQAHSAPEGLYAHQLAHIFFIISMGVLIYWLRARQLVQSAGWRYIQYAALFFILWNLDAFIVHLLEEQLAVIDIQRINPWQIHITASNHSKALVWLYYFAKFDHLLCVPALLLLYFGLRRLIKTTETPPPRLAAS